MSRFDQALRGLASALLMAAAARAACAQTPDVRGAGATFPSPVYAAWAAQYRRETGIEVAYDAIGSGTGVERIERRLVDFGASDAPLSPKELQRLGVLQFPAVIGGVVPVLNVPGIRPGQLRLNGEVLAAIYLGTVRRWNDRSIAGLNPGLALPDANITVVHRSDSSGTSFIWSRFLSGWSPAWKSRVGASNLPPWPTGVGTAGNEGVASLVQRTRLSIGFVEYAYAKQHGLNYASLMNRAGEFVSPGRASFEAAVASAGWLVPADLDRTLIDAPGVASWPITAASFILIGTAPPDAPGSLATMRFFDWAFARGGPAANGLDYVPIPSAAVALIAQVWADSVRDSLGQAVWKPHRQPAAEGSR